MIARLATWFAGRWASAAASNYLAIILVASIGIAGVYVQQLRVRAAECQASQEIMERYERLVERLEEQRNDDRDDAIEELEAAVSVCLDALVSDLLRGNSVEGERVPEDGIEG